MCLETLLLSGIRVCIEKLNKYANTILSSPWDLLLLRRVVLLRYFHLNKTQGPLGSSPILIIGMTSLEKSAQNMDDFIHFVLHNQRIILRWINFIWIKMNMGCISTVMWKKLACNCMGWESTDQTVCLSSLQISKTLGSVWLKSIFPLLLNSLMLIFIESW